MASWLSIAVKRTETNWQKWEMCIVTSMYASIIYVITEYDAEELSEVECIACPPLRQGCLLQQHLATYVGLLCGRLLIDCGTVLGSTFRFAPAQRCIII